MINSLKYMFLFFFRTIQLYEKSNVPAQIYLISEYHSFFIAFYH